MIAAIHQPQYLPWSGYIDKIRRADAFCFLDNVQYKKNEWQNRNRIKNVQGAQWLTVPALYEFGQKIRDIKINNKVKWGKKHFAALRTNYAKAPFFKEHSGFFEETFSRQWESLADLNIHIIEYFIKVLEISDTKTVRASDLKNLSEDPTGRLIDICRTLGADTYLAGADGANYMDMETFDKNGIKVIFQQYVHPEYPQLFGEFISHLSVLDVVFNMGPESPALIFGQNK